MRGSELRQILLENQCSTAKHPGLFHRLMMLRIDQRGITGLETAIVLIAFVVVASVFAFAVLSTGLISSETSKKAVLGALEDTSSTLMLRGGVAALANSDVTALITLKFIIGNAGQSYESVEVSHSAMIVTYLDEDNALNITTANWTPTWLIGSGVILDPGEQVEIVVNLTGMTPLLGTSKEFTIQIKPEKGAVLTINRTTPAELKAALDLQ